MTFVLPSSKNAARISPSILYDKPSYSGELTVPDWGIMVRWYCSVPLLILMCLTSRTIGDPDLPPCSTDGTTVIQQLPGWDYLGCYRDEMSTRLLSKYYCSSENMTVTSCASKCSNQGCAYIGLEFSFQCWCDNALDPRAIPVDPSNCDMACCTDNSVACGGN